jgi:predicted DNA-binding transcriptional regulator AlpA
MPTMKRQAPEDNSPKKDDVRVMLNAKQVLSLIAISRTTLFRLEREKLFPQGQAITPHRKLWFKDEVIAWQRDLQDEDSALSQKVRLRPRPKRRAPG